MTKLVYHPGHFDERTFLLEEGTTVIGRAAECDVCILDVGLSRRHAVIDVQGGRLEVVDLKSKNGTFVNGVRVDREEIHPRDAIRLGDVAFAVVDDEGTAPTVVDPAPTLVMSVSRVPIEDLLGDATQGALRVKDASVEQRAKSRLAILLKVSQILTTHEAIDALLRKILDLVFQILDVDRAAILIADATTGRVEPRTIKCKHEGSGPTFSRGIADYVYSKNVAALFADASHDPRLHTSESVLFQSIRAAMCVPLRSKDRTIGVLYVDELAGRGRFSEEDLEFLAAFADHAAVAIENASLRRLIEEEAIARTQLVMEAKLASLSALVSGIAHELRNPLNFINNFAELSAELSAEVALALTAQRERIDPRAYAEMAETLAQLGEGAGKIAVHGRRADAIIGSMLLHASGASRAREPFDLNALVAQSVKVAGDGARARDPSFSMAVHADYDASIGLVDMVSTDIHRVFVSVVDNACHAMREKKRKLGASYVPTLKVTTADIGAFVEIRIRDNGIGIPREIEGRIFHPFFTTKPPGEGTGLGLSLSYDIVVQGHRGSIRAETSPGELTELVIALPKRSVGVDAQTNRVIDL